MWHYISNKQSSSCYSMIYFLCEQGQAVQGVLHGKVVMRNSNGAVTFNGGSVWRINVSLYHIISGQYRDGYPDGSVWIQPPDDNSNSTGALHIQFRGGHLHPDRAVFMDRVTDSVWTGEYFDGETYRTFYAQLMMVSTSALINITVHCM